MEAIRTQATPKSLRHALSTKREKVAVEETQKCRRRRRRRHSKGGVRGGRSPPEGCPRVEAIEVSEFAIAFASYIEGDTGLLIILIVMAEERTDASIHDPLIQGSASP